MTHEDGEIRIHVEPEPAPEEMAAIVAAVGALSARARPETGPASMTEGRDRWARAGRREVLRDAE